MSVSPRTAAGELPRYYELDPLRFQELCRDLWQAEKELEDVEVYGTSGQSQRGIDVLATRKDGNGLATGQCKCVVPSSFNAKLITDSVDEFLLYKPFWLKQGAKKFALFVASSATPRQIQDEKLDLPVPTELSEDVRAALLRADFLKLCERDAKIGMLAIGFAAQHAAHFGREVIEKVRSWLLRLAEAFHRGGESEEAVKGQLLSAAFSLYSREVNVDRYRELAKVTAQIIQRWPGIASNAKIMVDRMVEEIPNGDSRHLWRLQVELRRL